jgi:hypothetical protein
MEAVAAIAPDERPDLVVEVEVLLVVTEVPHFLAAAASCLSFLALLSILALLSMRATRGPETLHCLSFAQVFPVCTPFVGDFAKQSLFTMFV